MNAQTLQALRGLLFFSVPEAAHMIGGVGERTWRYWEGGRTAIPEDVIDTIYQLAYQRRLIINNALEVFKQTPAGAGIVLTYYEHLDDWLDEPILWRVHCSAMAELASQNKNVVLSKFNSVAYNNWLNGRVDDQSLRSAWSGVVK